MSPLCAGAGTARAEAVEKELGYFVRNVQRMQYGTFRSRGFFIGSGVIEAGCKTIIGARCKQSGMFWGEPGAENILALRCISASRRLNDFWKTRAQLPRCQERLLGPCRLTEGICRAHRLVTASAKKLTKGGAYC